MLLLGEFLPFNWNALVRLPSQICRHAAVIRVIIASFGNVEASADQSLTITLVRQPLTKKNRSLLIFRRLYWRQLAFLLTLCKTKRLIYKKFFHATSLPLSQYECKWVKTPWFHTRIDGYR